MRYRTLAVVGTCLFAGVASAAGTYTSDTYKSSYNGSYSSAGVVGGSGMQGPLSRIFGRLDHNADKVISKDEARQHTWFNDQEFTRYDKDMDGRLSNVEVETVGAASANDQG